jgi:hypothetical protein
LLVGFETIGGDLVPALLTFGCLGLGAAAGLCDWLHARHTSQPLLELSLLRQQPFFVGCAAGTLFRLGVGALERDALGLNRL